MFFLFKKSIGFLGTRTIKKIYLFKRDTKKNDDYSRKLASNIYNDRWCA